jgi:protein-disulfide isomerase
MRFAISLLLISLICSPIQAQTKKKRKPQDQTLQTIQTQQQQIISQLNDIKQLLATAMGGAPQPTPPSQLSVGNQNFRGDGNAPVAIIEYADFECPYCGEYEREVYPQLSRDYIETGKVKYFYRDMPLPIHSHSMIAARAARCAGEQGKFWEMHDSLFAKQNAIRDVDMPGRAQELGLDGRKFSECLSSDRYTDELKRSANEAQKMGVDGTPGFFIGTAGPDGKVTNLKMILGMRPYEAFKSAIDDTLAAKK